jgi:tetratricopeptide (TPR) repeat protein
MCSTRCSLRMMVLALACVFGGVAGARPETPARGKAHLQRGLQLYRDGLYQNAIAEFESGYAALPRPAFLLNIAQAYRKLNQLEQARNYYQQFALRSPRSDPARAQALAIVDKIDAQLRAQAAESAHMPATTPPATREPLETTPPVTTTAPPETTPPAVATVASPFATPPVAETPPTAHSRTAGWTGVGLIAGGTAALGVGLGLTLESLQLEDRYLHPTMGMAYDPNLIGQRDLYRNVGVAFLAGGGAILVVGTILAARYLPARHALRVGLASRLEVSF